MQSDVLLNFVLQINTQNQQMQINPAIQQEMQRLNSANFQLQTPVLEKASLPALAGSFKNCMPQFLPNSQPYAPSSSQQLQPLDGSQQLPQGPQASESQTIHHSYNALPRPVQEVPSARLSGNEHHGWMPQFMQDAQSTAQGLGQQAHDGSVDLEDLETEPFYYIDDSMLDLLFNPRLNGSHWDNTLDYSGWHAFPDHARP